MKNWLIAVMLVWGTYACSSAGEVTEVKDSSTPDAADTATADVADAVADNVLPGDTGVDLGTPDTVPDSNPPQDVQQDDSCTPQCAGKECGDDGCGGECGKCPSAAPICDDGLCKVECKPTCEGKECGDDGCGGSCGECPQAAPFCKAGLCAVSCDADCTDLTCGDDGCGGSCGSCQPGWYCKQGNCACDPKCANMQCGSDGCGGSCGECPESAPFCVAGQCKATCIPTCAGKQCGDDGCGGSCGPCDGPNQSCQNGLCICTPSCAPGACGDNGCGGSCPECPCGQVCENGLCMEWACKDKQCGSDGCGGTCGTCPGGFMCSADGLCQDSCDLACVGRQCGEDGCGGMCGICTGGKVCTDAGLCVETCTPDCTGKACGPNGCGGICGQCQPAAPFCSAAGTCQTLCQPECGMKVCGEDGCGGSCGTCDAGLNCTVAGTCGGLCVQCGFEPECMDITFAEGNLGKWSVLGADVITNFGLTPAVTGGHMLKLTTAAQASQTDDAASASLQNCLPAGAYQVFISWKLISEEFKEFCGSNYQDAFTITITTASGNMTKKTWVIDDLCGPADCTGCGSHYSSLTESDVELDQDDPWATDWYLDAVPLALSGPDTRFTVTLTAEDAGDGIFDTVVLIDRIRFETCANACQNIECGPSPCGVDCGVCPNGGICQSGVCCQPSCAGKECGGDGCGGNCGACGVDTTCLNGLCECKYESCSDGCCDPGEVCGVVSGKCCMPQCTTACAADGCGGICPGPNGATCCSFTAQCNDNDPCTVDTCLSGYCSHEPSSAPECCVAFGYSEDFDDGSANGFAFTQDAGGFPGFGGAWSASNACGSYSPAYALYFGLVADPLGGGSCTYSLQGLPLPSGGTATTPVLQLPDAPTSLSFRVYADIMADASDVLTVSVVQGTTVTTIWSKADLVGGVGPTWKSVQTDLSSYGGESIQLRFTFSTSGATDGTKTGPRFDDIQVQSVCGP